MKKFLAVLLLFAMVFMLAACGSKSKAPEAEEPETNASEIVDPKTDTETKEEASPETPESSQGFGMANPWVDADGPEAVLEATGFALKAPAEAVNIAYSYNTEAGMAQLNYNLDDAMWVYRMQHTEALEDISGIYCEWDYVGDTTFGDMNAMEFSYVSDPTDDQPAAQDCVRIFSWFDPQNKVTHCLAALGPDLNGLDIDVYAEKLMSAADTNPSFLGLHVSTYDGSDIMVEEKADGSFSVNVSIFRLCTLDDGVGTMENGDLVFDTTDPNGDPMKGRLFYNGVGSLCLEIAESTWSLLPAGTVMEGFDQ